MFTSMDTMKEDLQSLLFIDSNTKNRNSGYVDVFPHHYNHKDGYKTDKCGWDTINPNIRMKSLLVMTNSLFYINGY